MVNAGKTHDDIVEGVNYARDITKVYCCVKDLSYGVRGGRVPNSVKVIADLLHIRPILTTNESGKLEKVGAVLGKKRLGKKMVKYMGMMRILNHQNLVLHHWNLYLIIFSGELDLIYH